MREEVTEFQQKVKIKQGATGKWAKEKIDK